jgi:predicted amidohydrolase YtcJ
VGRAAQVGLVLSMQPAHLLTDISLVDRHWGSRGEGAYAFRSLLNAGAHLVFGSDVPVASIDPRDGVYAALERVNAEGAPAGGWNKIQRLGLMETLRAYTMEAARAAGAGSRRGMLAPGYDADLVAWAVDPAAEHGNGRAFRQGYAALTVVGGEIMMMRV